MLLKEFSAFGIYLHCLVGIGYGRDHFAIDQNRFRNQVSVGIIFIKVAIEAAVCGIEDLLNDLTALNTTIIEVVTLQVFAIDAPQFFTVIFVDHGRLQNALIIFSLLDNIALYI